MKPNIEKEYKILVTQEQFEKLLQDYPQAIFHKQMNTYYDTKDHAIRKAHCAMRIREVDQIYLFTLKKHTKEGVMEYETKVAENDPVIFKQPEIKALLDEISIKDPIQKITTLTTYRAVIDTGNAELCFDYNEYGNRKDFEIEYEYKKDHDGKTAFNQILSSVGLVYHKNCTSKIKRAFQTL